MTSRYAFVLLPLFLLTGCFDDTRDLQAYTQQVQSEVQPWAEPIPKINPFQHIPYSPEGGRDPFALPDRQSAMVDEPAVANCKQPPKTSESQVLQQYALDNLKLKGAIGQNGELWAIIETMDGHLHRVKEGAFMGLFFGKVKQVTPEFLLLTEMIPDGSGCWQERDTRVELFVDTTTETTTSN